MYSMTGSGYAEQTFDFGTLVLELQSVNRRFLEVSVFLPRQLSRFEMDIRKKISSELYRGSVTARYSLYSSQKRASVQLKLLKERAEYWRKAAKELKCSVEDVTLPFLLNELKEMGLVEESDKIWEGLEIVTDKALDDLLAMRKKEGKSLEKDMKRSLQEIASRLDDIENQAPKVVDSYKEKLENRVKKWSTLEFDERVMREISFLADRVDITEEIVRLRSHIKLFTSLFIEERQGKKMDFYIQEMGREANTIASKSMSPSISQDAIVIKHELEKMREQTQNIE